MTNWLIPIIAAFGAAFITLLGREIIEWYRRPRLEIDFEEEYGEKPVILDLYDDNQIMLGYQQRYKCFRLVVTNKGKKPSLSCEAKLEVRVAEGKKRVTNVVFLHWARRDPILYREDTTPFDKGEKIFAPIDLSVGDDEPLDVFRLSYHFSTTPDTDLSPKYKKSFESISHRELVLQPNAEYLCKVTIYCSSTSPKVFLFKVNWDGTVENFRNAFRKGWKDEQQVNLPIQKKDYLNAGILFFLFSTTLYIYGDNQFVLEFWKWTWHAPFFISLCLFIMTQFVLVCGTIISICCLIGIIKPNIIERLLNSLSKHQRFMKQLKDIYIPFFSLAFLLNFYMSFIQKLSGVIRTPIVFFIVFIFGLTWGFIIANQKRYE